MSARNKRKRYRGPHPWRTWVRERMRLVDRSLSTRIYTCSYCGKQGTHRDLSVHDCEGLIAICEVSDE